MKPNLRMLPLVLASLLMALWGCRDASGSGDVGAKAEESILVWVFNQALEDGVVLNSSMLSKRSIAKAYLSPSALRESDAAKVMGRKLFMHVSRGDVLTWSMIGPATDVHLGSQVKAPGRAVSLPVTVASGVAGHLRPMDRVDVLVSYKGTGSSDARTMTFLKDVTVLAVGDLTAGSDLTEADPEKMDHSTVTVFVLPEEAAMLAWAVSNGSLHLTLRNKLDQKDQATSATTWSSIRNEAERKRLESERKDIELGGRQ